MRQIITDVNEIVNAKSTDVFFHKVCGVVYHTSVIHIRRMTLNEILTAIKNKELIIGDGVDDLIPLTHGNK